MPIALGDSDQYMEGRKKYTLLKVKAKQVNQPYFFLLK